MEDDIYNKLLLQGVLKREVDIQKKKENKKKDQILNKILYRKIKLNDEDKFIPNIISVRDEKNMVIENLINKKNTNYIKYLMNKFSIELNNYKYIDCNNIDLIKPGGYLRCIDLDENIKWGGCVIKLINKNNISKLSIQLMNTRQKFWKVKFDKYYVFYKKNVSKRDKFRDIFMKKANLNF